jgi:hypothetical protein
MQIEPDTQEYETKLIKIKVVSLNIFAGLLSPFYQFYKGMRLFGLLVLVPLLFRPLAPLATLALLLFNDYVYLHYCVHRIKAIRRGFEEGLDAGLGEGLDANTTSYYETLRVRGTPSISRGILEGIIAFMLFMLVLSQVL